MPLAWAAQMTGPRRTGSAAAAEAEMDGHFGGVGAGDEVGGADEVEEFVAGEPAAAVDGFVVPHGDVDGGAAEGGEAEFAEEEGDFAEVGRGGHVRSG